MSSYGGHRVTRLRATLAQTLPQPCYRCGQPVTPDTQWDIDHRTPIDTAPHLMWEPANLAVSHASCNRAHGARITNKRRNRHPISSATITAEAPLLYDLSPVSAGQGPGTTWGLPEPDLEHANWPRFATIVHPGAVGSYGLEVIEAAESRTHMQPRRTAGLRWWQKLAALRALEHDADGRLVWGTVLLTVPRLPPAGEVVAAS